ncbi:unnamed protein product [Mytilus edulis]|uniref:Reverse transcriptase domain-containing protein n=1 Tax=Mytilus edulis TaxID=6550 RepID=A0A8S3REL9_MYTED|nr:unnamed protein product [Mytilus edulis]
MDKAVGEDEIPAELYKNVTVIPLLHILFNKCFFTGIILEVWAKGIIHPIPKSSTGNARDPMNYRGITLVPVCYKLYCHVLNNRLNAWESENNILCDVQNGFRKGRSTIDHVTSLTSIIETRKCNRLSTFVAFIDFRKAYDCIDRTILFRKLQSIGIQGNIYNAIQSLYKSVECCVRINGCKTDWFNWSEVCSLNGRKCKNWNYRIRQQFVSADMMILYNAENVDKALVKNVLYDKLLSQLYDEWSNNLNKTVSQRNGNGGNKLRTYRTFKTSLHTEEYMHKVIVPSHRRAYAQFRCGVAPIRLETGRFERLPVQQRTCETCKNIVETEEHVLLECPLYDDLRNELFKIILSEHSNFLNFSNLDKLSIVLASNCDSIIIYSAKICKFILDRRRRFLYR